MIAFEISPQMLEGEALDICTIGDVYIVCFVKPYLIKMRLAAIISARGLPCPSITLCAQAALALR